MTGKRVERTEEAHQRRVDDLAEQSPNVDRDVIDEGTREGRRNTGKDVKDFIDSLPFLEEEAIQVKQDIAENVADRTRRSRGAQAIRRRATSRRRRSQIVDLGADERDFLGL